MKLLLFLGVICIFLSVVSLQPFQSEQEGDENQRQWRELLLNNQRNYEQERQQEQIRQYDAMTPIIAPIFGR